MKYALSASFGNDSMAMIQWAHERGLDGVAVVYCNTGWSAPAWANRIIEGERLARKCGFPCVHLKSIGMQELVRIKKGFPGNGQQFCTAHLKGVPFLEWIDEADPDRKAIVMVGKRRAESVKRRDIPEWIESSEYHGGRKIWHPLFMHSDEERNALLARAGIEILPHRSDECSPCVNANRDDFLRLTEGAIERVNDLEAEIGKPMYRPKRFGAIGIRGVVHWARNGRDRPTVAAEEADCASLFGCGL